jgi:plasmid stabilization system protein ParE
MRDITISNRAQKNIEILFNHIELKWSEKVKKKFALKLYDTLKIIQISPESFPKSAYNSNYHKCVLSKQTTIFYKYNSKQIKILSLFDTRQNPTKINKLK